MESLVRELPGYGIDNVVVAASSTGKDKDVYHYNDVQVFRYSTGTSKSPIDDFNGTLDSLKDSGTAVYHQHSWTENCGLEHLELAKNKGFKTFLTIHVPANICLRGTMMLYGKYACDGRIDALRCARCWLYSRGAPAPIAALIARVPAIIGAFLIRFSRFSRLFTALSAKYLASRKLSEFNRMLSASDRVIVVSEWLRKSVTLNTGDIAHEIIVSRQGVDTRLLDHIELKPKHHDDVYRLGYVGRWDVTKGLEVLMKCMQYIESSRIRLEIYGMCTTEAEEEIKKSLLNRYGTDERIMVHDKVAREGLHKVFADIDLLCVPSQWMETGPLVVYEAMAFNLDIAGSGLGGISECLDGYDKGYLVDDYYDAREWAGIITQALENHSPHEVAETEKRRRVRSMNDVAREMAGLYGLG